MWKELHWLIPPKSWKFKIQRYKIQDTDYEINELGGQTKKGHRGLQCWSCEGFDHLQRDCTTGRDDDDDQPDGPD